MAGFAAAVLLVGCSSEQDSASDDEREAADVSETAQPAGFERYVALGDSFTAAPLEPNTALAEGCFRSDGKLPEPRRGSARRPARSST